MAVLTEKGFDRPTYAELLDEQISRAKKMFGDDIETNELTALGKYIRLNTYDLSTLYELMEYVYYARFPNTATGISLDRLCLFAGITRNPATSALHKIVIYGEKGKTIEAGTFTVGTNDNIGFYLIESVTLNDDVPDEIAYELNVTNAGMAEALFACEDLGVIGNVPVGAITKIITPHTDVADIKHISIDTLGTDIENDVSLRNRFEKTIAGIGSGTVDSIYSAILRVTGVTGCYIIENDTQTIVDNRPPKSFEAYVLGGNDEEIAQAIFNKIPVGIATVTTVDSMHQRKINIEDIGGTPHTINFSRTIEKNIYAKINVEVDSHFETSGTDDIKSNIITHLANLTNGDDVIYSSLFSDVHRVTGVISATIKLSEDGETYTTDNIACQGSEVARSNTEYIEVEVTEYVDR